MNAAIEKILTSEMSKSKKMIALYEMNVAIKEIASIMNVRYNFVYNVVSNFCNVTGKKIATNNSNETSKKDVIIEMYVAGKSNKEISVDLKTNYNYVFNVIKQFKATNNSNVE